MLHHKSHYKTYIRLTLVLVILVLIPIIYFPESTGRLLKTLNFHTVQTMVRFLPAFFLLFGMVEVLVPKEKVISHLGRASGLHGSISAFLLGALLPGPVYMAFPMATMLLKKGASTFNTTLFISAWASLNITEEIFEVQFLGWRFLLLRILITIPLVVLIAWLTDKFAKPAAYKEEKISS